MLYGLVDALPHSDITVLNLNYVEYTLLDHPISMSLRKWIF